MILVQRFQESMEGYVIMSIKTFIRASKCLSENGFYEEALCLVCNAIDASAAACYPEMKVSERYKLFLVDNFRMITEVGFPGISADGIRIKVNTKVEHLKLDAEGYVNMEQIIYHVLRCGLVHSCNIDKRIEFVNYTALGDWKENKFILPKTIIWGLIAAVENWTQDNK